MSVCVNVRTEKELVAEDILNQLISQGEKIVVTSDEFPCVKFGIYLKSIRGIEINKEDNGYEVRICSFTSIADYQLFVKTIQVVMAMTKGRAYYEDDDEGEITNLFETLNEDWISRQYKSGFDFIQFGIRHGHEITLYGLFCNICVGPKLYQDFGIPLSGECDSDNMDKLMEHLCFIQWHSVNWEDTSTRMVLSSPSGDKKLTISMICIKEGKVTEFDYISEASLLSLMDMDDDSYPLVLIPFKEIWKILPEDIFVPLDERQYKRVAELTVDRLHEIMEAARYLQPDDLHYRPTYPGEGFDERQNTFILMWNPDNCSDITIEEHCYGVENIFTEFFHRSVWDYEKAKCGDRFFLMRVGEGNTGIVMSGVFDSQPYEAGEWNDREYYMDMLPNVILDPEKAPMVTTKDLCEAIPSFDWKDGRSGRILSLAEAQTLEKIWKAYLKENKDNVDGKTFNVNRSHTYDNIGF